MINGHTKQWNFLKRNFEQDQLSHAYLFAGEKQSGKRTFAKEFVKMVNCLGAEALAKAALSDIEKPRLRQGFGGQACQKCANCQMIEKGTFPDLMIVKSEEGQELQISKIREVQNFLIYKSYYDSGYGSGIKTVIIDEAEKMNQEAQSCFLKTLEEPKGKTLLILISSRQSMLLPTILSRCQTVKFFRRMPPAAGGVEQFNSKKSAEEKIISSELLKVINADFSEKFRYAKSVDFEKQKIGDILEALQKYFRQLLLAKIGVSNPPSASGGGGKEAENYSVSKIKKDIKLIEDINGKLLFANANPKLALEVLLMELD